MNAEQWVDPWPDHPTIRKFDPAREVLVDLDKALNLARNSPRADRVSLRVKATGVQLTGVVEAQQLAWVQASSGSWLAILKVQVNSGNGLNSLVLDICVAADAVYPPTSQGT